MIKRDYLKIPATDMNMLGLALIAQGIIFTVLSFLIDIFSIDEGISVIIITIIAFIPLAVYFGMDNLKEAMSLKRRKLGIRGLVFFFLAIFLVNIVITVISDQLEVFINLFGFTGADIDHGNQASATVGMLIYSIIVAPLVEEMIYRGVVMRSLEKYGTYTAIIASSILFGTMHQDFFQTPVAVFTGIILGYVAYKYSLRASIAIHILNNFSVEFGLRIEKFSTFGGIGYEGVILISSIAVMLIYSIVKRKKIENWINMQIDKFEKYRKGIENHTRVRFLKMFFTRTTVIGLLIFDITMNLMFSITKIK